MVDDPSKSIVLSNEKRFRLDPETLLKIAGASVGLVAAMGIPAVVLHSHRFGIPSYAAGAETAAKAGIVPAALLILAAAHVFYVVRQYRIEKPIWAALLAWQIILLPGCFAGAVLGIAGTYASVFLGAYDIADWLGYEPSRPIGIVVWCSITIVVVERQLN